MKHACGIGGNPTYRPEPGSPELDEVGKRASGVPFHSGSIKETLPNVLVIGDSIAIGYFKFVQDDLRDRANVFCIPENGQGTTHALARLDGWLGCRKWDLIHFNFGLHDLKRVQRPGTDLNSDSPEDPHQASVGVFGSNLGELTSRLLATEALLVFATITPVPEGVSPYRDPADVYQYNDVAVSIMEKKGVMVNDLFRIVSRGPGNMQKKANVHFTEAGSRILASAVVSKIGGILGV